MGRILKPERRELTVVALYAVCVGLLSLAVPITASAVVNSVALTTLFQQLAVLCMALGGALALAMFLQVLQQVAVEYIQRRVFVRVAGALAHALPRVELKAFDRQHGPELVNRFFDVLTVQKAAATLLMDGLALALQMLIGLVLLATYDTILLGFDALLIVGLIVLLTIVGRRGVATAIDESIAKYAVAGWLEELARHPVAFKFAGGPALARSRTDALARDYLLTRAAHFRVLLRQVIFALALHVIGSVTLLGIGGWLVIIGQLTLGQLVAAQIVVNLVVNSLTKIGKQLESWYDLLAASDKVGHLLDLPAEKDGGAALPATAAGMAVEFKSVSFTYDDAPAAAIQEFSLLIEAGSRVALVGPNGSGKTTFAELMLGLRTPQAGWIEIDRIDLRDLDPVALRDQLAVVGPLEIFEGTIAENLRVGRPHLGLHELRQALADVGLLEDALRLPQGLETPLVAGGAPFSLGQAERLMVARAILGRPRLLVLDETLDALDHELRAEILPALLAPEAPWTLVVVTHSTEIAATCDRQIRFERPR
jgi:ABC-type bacteriocin/lantibiotic exporter with double-glycine peptidase domain